MLKLLEPLKTMHSSYRIAAELLRDRLKEQDPEAGRYIEDIEAADVIVVKGQYDHIETVFDSSDMPHTLIDPSVVPRLKLRPDQIVFINCPGKISNLACRNLEKFVSEGGFLFTTDWSLKNVLEVAFPGVLQYNERLTGDDVVRVEILDTEDPFLKSLMGPEDDPQWWLEASSYPIRILAPDRVHVLLSSRDLGEKWGENPVFVTFDHGEGKVYHMISHFYLQRSETRTARHANSAANYMQEKGISPSLKEKYQSMGIDQENLADVESAFTSTAMFSKVIYDKKQRMKGNKDI